jgi:hypothetical protein
LQLPPDIPRLAEMPAFMGQGQIKRKAQPIPHPGSKGGLHPGPPDVEPATPGEPAGELLMHAQKPADGFLDRMAGAGHKLRRGLPLQPGWVLHMPENLPLPPRVPKSLPAAVWPPSGFPKRQVPFREKTLAGKYQVLNAVAHRPAAGSRWRVKLRLGQSAGQLSQVGLDGGYRLEASRQVEPVGYSAHTLVDAQIEGENYHGRSIKGAKRTVINSTPPQASGSPCAKCGLDDSAIRMPVKPGTKVGGTGPTDVGGARNIQTRWVPRPCSEAPKR